MITALDTNVLLDVLIPGAPAQAASRTQLDAAAAAGALIISEAVLAELAAVFPSQAALDEFLTATGIRLAPAGPAALWRAGEAWRASTLRHPRQLLCPQCGAVQTITCTSCSQPLRPRQHVVADFLIGAHALSQADRLLTRDRGFYRAYFPGLLLIGQEGRG